MRSMKAFFLLGAVAACGPGTPPAGEVVFGTLTVKWGNVASSVLTDRISALRLVMEACYAGALAKNPGTDGVLDMKLTGESSGIAVEVTKNTVENTSLTQCITEAVRGVKADSSGSFVAEWSVNFNPEG